MPRLDSHILRNSRHGEILPQKLPNYLTFHQKTLVSPLSTNGRTQLLSTARNTLFISTNRWIGLQQKKLSLSFRIYGLLMVSPQSAFSRLCAGLPPFVRWCLLRVRSLAFLGYCFALVEHARPLSSSSAPMSSTHWCLCACWCFSQCLISWILVFFFLLTPCAPSAVTTIISTWSMDSKLSNSGEQLAEISLIMAQ